MPQDVDLEHARTVTLTQHLMKHQPPGSKGDFTLLMMAVQTAVRIVEKNIRRAGLHGSFGLAGGSNSTGDDQKKLDIISNEAFKIQLISSEKICVLGSEEEDRAMLVRNESDHHAQYLICFDPLDGSSNIDANVTVGSIWGIWKMPSDMKITTEEEANKAMLQPGNLLVSAGYAMYGSATNLVLTCGKTVDCFTLDSTIGEFLLTQENLKIPPRRSIYSVNEGNSKLWASWFTKYLKYIKYDAKDTYSLRYIGSMVGDVHRTILYGGIFMYPADTKSKNGKIRLLYEAAPLAMIVEIAGGKASTGDARIMDVTPKALHHRVPVFLGSCDEVDLCLSFKNAGHNSKL
eukprot:Tbor_TRINITY_DN5595_c3_g2::TRINITY_DN5595_c3_g2_i1::g.13314::m.13314/K03841/FBP, fbp; fructose-1,6-bisphosphatase I